MGGAKEGHPGGESVDPNCKISNIPPFKHLILTSALGPTSTASMYSSPGEQCHMQLPERSRAATETFQHDLG